jgi:hypothetical protein
VGTLATAGAVLTLALGCGSIGARPYLTPLPDAIIDTVPGEPAAVIGELQTLVMGEGLAVRVSSPAEGFLETEWYDVVRRGPVGGSLDPQRIVRIRFLADAVSGSTSLLTSEAVTLRAFDPSVPDRQNEVMVPPGHSGAQILERILIALRNDLGPATP